MIKPFLFLSTALILTLLTSLFFLRPQITKAATISEQTTEYSTTLEVWQVIQELGSNLSGTAGTFTFRIKTDISYTQQFEFTAQNTRIYDKDNGSSSIAGCVPIGSSPNDLLRGLQLNTGNAPTGYMDVSVDFSCRNYTFIPGHRYLIKITNANKGTPIHFATATSLTSAIDHYPDGGLKYAYNNPFEPVCNPINYIWGSQFSNNGCIVFTSPKDDLYFLLSDPNGPTIPDPSPSPTPSPSPSGNTPLIFIPGIAGSELKINEDVPWVADDGHGGVYTHTYDKDEVVWLNELEVLKPGNDDYFDVLRLMSDGNESVAKVEPTGEIIDRAYQKTIDYFVNQGYILNKDLFIFGYDWRKDLMITTADLNGKISEIRQNTNSEKVNLVTHSMGGLLARNFIKDPSMAQNINKLIAIAPPFLGSPKSLKSIMYGDCLFGEVGSLCISLNQAELKDITQNLPTMYQLFPSKKYYSFYDTTVPFRDERDIDDNGIIGNLDYEQTKQLLTNQEYNTKLYIPAEELHSTDNNLSNTDEVDMTIIAGSGNATLGQIIEKYKYDFFGNKIASKDELMINGDSTVPLFSASLNDPSRNISLFNPDKVFYAHDSHGGLITNTSVLNFTKNLLNNNPLTVDGISGTPFQLKGSLFSVHSPVEIHAYDALGNHTGPTAEGEYETNIPGSSYDTLDDAKFIFLPDEGIYQFKFKATGSGSFDFKIRDYAANKNIKTQVYKDIPLTEETTGQIFIDNNTTSPAILTLDLDGDGINDKQFTPTESLSDASGDTTAPKTNVTLNGQKENNDWYNSEVIINLEGIDEEDGSGISKIEYSLDEGMTVNQYSEPFTVKNEGISKLRVKATDKNGNEETLQNIEIKIDKTPPEVKIIFNLTTKAFDFIGIDNLSSTTKTDSGSAVTIRDEAGNSTKLTLSSKIRPRKENISLKSIQYNYQNPINLTGNLLGTFYILNKKQQITFLLQRIIIQNEERLYSIYNPLNDLSNIYIKKPSTKFTTQEIKGKVLLYLETKKGSLEASF